MNFKKLVKKVWDGLVKLADAFLFGVGVLVCIVTTLISKYIQSKRDQQNAQLRQHQYSSCQSLEFFQYAPCANVLRMCIADNASRCGLEAPKNKAQIFAAPGRRVVFDEKYGCFCNVFKIRRSIHGSIKGGELHVIPDVDLTPQEIGEILNDRLPNFCDVNGLRPVKVINCSLGQRDDELVVITTVSAEVYYG